MTRLLTSVTGADEAEIALAGQADIIDIVMPGRAAPEIVRGIVDAVGHRCAVSVLAGDGPMQPEALAATVAAIAACGVDFVRIGLFPKDDIPACLRALRRATMTTNLVAVFFADASPDLSLVNCLPGAGFAGAMIDTRTTEAGAKEAGRLLDHVSLSVLRRFVEACHTAGLTAGLAGSLETPDIPRLLMLGPDLLGFRGALCGPAGRTGTLDLRHVRAVRAQIPPEGLAPETRDVDYRLLTPRGHASANEGEDFPVDRVFVEDLVLPVFIGAYTRERDRPQRVRFSVVASVARTGRVAEGMRDVFSYDLITDGIRLLIDAGHVALVETLAERIAAMVLAHPRVMKVVVKVQKLDTGSGTVGVEIERKRSAARAAQSPVVPFLAEGSATAGKT